MPPANYAILIGAGRLLLPDNQLQLRLRLRRTGQTLQGGRISLRNIFEPGTQVHKLAYFQPEKGFQMSIEFL
jgi:hypothetical protein